MDNTNNEKFCCEDYQVVEEGKTFWRIDDFYPSESKSCESVMPCGEKPSLQKSCAKKVCQSSKKPIKHKSTCKRPASAGTNQCTGKSFPQIMKQESPKTNSDCPRKVCASPPKVNKECVVILPPTERKSNSANLNQDSCYDSAVEKSSCETVTCRICSSLQKRSSQASQGSQGLRGSQGSRGSQGERGSLLSHHSSNASEHSIKSERKSSIGSLKQESCHDSATTQNSCGTLSCRVCSCKPKKSSQTLKSNDCNAFQQLAKPFCSDQVAKPSQIAIKMCIENPNEDMSCGDVATDSQPSRFPCNIVMDFKKNDEDGSQQPKRVQLSLKIYINGDNQNSAQLAIEGMDCCCCNQ